MHDIRFIRDNPDAFDRGLERRGLAPQAARLIALDEKRRARFKPPRPRRRGRNAASKEIGEAKKSKNEAKAQDLLAEVAALKESIPALEAEERKTTEELNHALAEIPNLPLDEVPDGKDSNDNVEHHRFGAKRDYAFTPKQHFDLGEALGQMDFETAAKLSGARFVVLKKGLARLERALGQFMLDVHTSEPHNYTEVSPPLLGARQMSCLARRNCQSSQKINFIFFLRNSFGAFAAIGELLWKQASDFAEQLGMPEARAQESTFTKGRV